MLGIQNSLPVNNTVKFGRAGEEDYYQDRRFLDDMPDEFSKASIEAERDKKMADIDQGRANLDEIADTLDKNPDKLSKKASKIVRFGSAALGLVGTYVMAKYGSKASINAFKSFGKSETAGHLAKAGKSIIKPLKDGFVATKGAFTKFIGNPIVQSLKNTKAGKAVQTFFEKPGVKNFIERVDGYKEAGKVLLKSVNGEKIQNAVENTMAASATASVLIDDLAGRNNDKSNLDLALGASGGDK